MYQHRTSSVFRLFSTTRLNRAIIRPLEQSNNYNHNENNQHKRKPFLTWQKILFMSSFSFVYYKLKSSFIVHTTVSTPEIKVNITGIDSTNSLKETLDELEIRIRALNPSNMNLTLEIISLYIALFELYSKCQMKREAICSLLIPLKMFESQSIRLNDEDIGIVATLLGSIVSILPPEQTKLCTSINEFIFSYYWTGNKKDLGSVSSLLTNHFQIDTLEKYPSRKHLQSVDYNQAVIKFNSLPPPQLPLINVNHVIKDQSIIPTDQNVFIKSLTSFSGTKIPIYNTLTACMNLFESYERNNQLGSAIILAEKMLTHLESSKNDICGKFQINVVGNFGFGLKAINQSLYQDRKILSNNLSVVYYNTCDTVKAKEWGMKTLEYIEEDPGMGELMIEECVLASTLLLLAKVHHSDGEFVVAEKYVQRLRENAKDARHLRPFYQAGDRLLRQIRDKD